MTSKLHKRTAFHSTMRNIALSNIETNIAGGKRQVQISHTRSDMTRSFKSQENSLALNQKGDRVKAVREHIERASCTWTNLSRGLRTRRD